MTFIFPIASILIWVHEVNAVFKIPPLFRMSCDESFKRLSQCVQPTKVKVSHFILWNNFSCLRLFICVDQLTAPSDFVVQVDLAVYSMRLTECCTLEFTANGCYMGNIERQSGRFNVHFLEQGCSAWLKFDQEQCENDQSSRCHLRDLFQIGQANVVTRIEQ